MTTHEPKTLSEEVADDPELRSEVEREWFADSTIIKIEEKMRELGLTRKELANRMKCTPANITQLLRRGRSNLTLDTLMGIALALEHRFLAPELVPLASRAPWECSGTDGIEVRVSWEAREEASASMTWSFQALEAEASSAPVPAPYSAPPSGAINAH